MSPVAIQEKQKEKEEFRDYKAASDTVSNFYQQQHRNQTVAFNKQAREKWKPGSYVKVVRPEIANFVKDGVLRTTIWEALVILDQMIDESDPDTDNTQLNHGFQCAESMRRANLPRWMQCVGLIHDAGKVLNFLDNVPAQWCVVGDTFVVGCEFPDSIVYGRESFVENPDFNHPVYSTKYGMYEPNCGLDNVLMSFGHDEYLYQVLRDSDCTLPQEALAVIRYHSFYPWHREGAYSHLMNSSVDQQNLEWVKVFNPYDLYSKSDTPVVREEVESYYRELLDEFFPSPIQW